MFVIVYIHHLPRTTLLPGTYYELQELSLTSVFFYWYTSTKKSAITVNNFAKENSNTDHKQKLNFGSIRKDVVKHKNEAVLRCDFVV